MSFCSHRGIVNTGKDPVIHCLLRIFCDRASTHLFTTLKSLCYFFFFWQKLCSILNAAVQLQASVTYYRLFLQDLFLFWHSSIQKKHSGFVFSLWTCCCISEAVESMIFHFHSDFQQPQNWNKVTDFHGFRKCSLNFPEITLDWHYEMNLFGLYLSWMLTLNIIIWFFCSFATEVKLKICR